MLLNIKIFREGFGRTLTRLVKIKLTKKKIAICLRSSFPFWLFWPDYGSTMIMKTGWTCFFLNKRDAEQEANFFCLSSQAIPDGATSKIPFKSGFCHLFLKTKKHTSELFILTRTWIITDLGVEIGTQDPPKILEPLKVSACLIK